MATVDDVLAPIQDARNALAEGNAKEALYWLQIVEHRATNKGSRIPTEEITAVLDEARASGYDIKEAYQKLAEEKLRDAERSATVGSLDGVIMYLKDAFVCASRGESCVPKERVKDIFQTTYVKGIMGHLSEVGRHDFGRGITISEPTLTKIEDLARQEGLMVAEKYIGELSTLK